MGKKKKEADIVAAAMPDNFEVGRRALRSFNLITQPATQTVADVLGGWWDDGTCRYWQSGSYGHWPDWSDGICIAECRAARLDEKPHIPPAKGCTCGIYASLSYADLLKQFREQAKRMITVISVAGTTVIGTRGLKTARAQVVAYWTVPQTIERTVAEMQFKNARLFDDPLTMMEHYNIALLPPPDPHSGAAGGPSWWTGGKTSHDH